MAKPTNSYISKYVPENLLWFERDGLMAWYDQDKCRDFLRDTNKHFREAKIVNFDRIHRECQAEVVPPDLLKYYQTVNEKEISWYPSYQQTEIRSSAFRADRKDTYFEKKTIEKQFTKKKKKIKGSSFTSKFFLIFSF